MAKEADDKWEIWNVAYQTPVFGAEETQYCKDVKWMKVASNRGRHDAKTACERLHPKCRVLATVSKFEFDTPGVADRLIDEAISKFGGAK